MPVSSEYAPPQDPLEILHEDHQIIVVDKPAGLLSVPGRGADLADCLLTRVQAVFATALLVHRLDRDTSGVMVFAQTPHAQTGHGRVALDRRLAKPAAAEGLPRDWQAGDDRLAGGEIYRMQRTGRDACAAQPQNGSQSSITGAYAGFGACDFGRSALCQWFCARLFTPDAAFGRTALASPR